MKCTHCGTEWSMRKNTSRAKVFCPGCGMPAPKFPVPADAVCRPEDYTIVNGYLKKYSGNAPIIRIPDGVHMIADSAFQMCTTLREIFLPDSVTSIGSNAFLGCSGLTRVTVPADCSILSGAFPEGCTVIRR